MTCAKDPVTDIPVRYSETDTINTCTTQHTKTVADFVPKEPLKEFLNFPKNLKKTLNFSIIF